MNKILIAICMAALISGCTAEQQAAFADGYNRGAIVRNAVLEGLGNYCTGYANAVRGPVIYTQPQHGVANIYVNGQPMFIQY